MSYSIGQFSVLTKISIHTLRYYEKENLIIPNRKPNGRRYYVKQDIAWIEFIKRLKETGMRIQTIKKYAKLRAEGDKTMSERLTMLTLHYEYLKNEIAKSQDHLDKLALKIRFYQKNINKSDI